MGKGWPLYLAALVICCSTSWSKTPVDDWTFKVRLFSPHYKDQENYIGVWSGCERGYDPEDAPEPPALPGRPNVASLPPDGSSSLALDLRPPVLSEESWLVQASFLESGSPHTLVFDYVDAVPEEYAVEFKDLVSGETISLRSIREYVFVPSEMESNRNFMVTVTKPLPEPPSFVQAIRSGKTLTVSWSQSASPFVTGYVVYLGTGAGIVTDHWHVGHEDLGLVAEGLRLSRYYVAVSAVDNAFREGELSEWCAVVPRVITRYDMTHDGNVERNDVFLLAANWMSPVSEKDQEGEDVTFSVDGRFLQGFVQTWRDLRSPAEDTLQNPDPPVTDTDVEFLVKFLELANAGQI
jgi:hypothetical protein